VRKDRQLLLAFIATLAIMTIFGCGNGEDTTTSTGTSGDNGTGINTPKVPVRRLSVITNVQVTGGADQMTISWDPVASAVSYNIYWSTTPDVSSTSNFITGTNSPYVQTGLAPATIYYYAVAAVYVGGPGTLSPEFSGTTLP
jgi:hypothetical protein